MSRKMPVDENGILPNGKKILPLKTCPVCGGQFKISRNLEARGRGAVCSISCKVKARAEKNGDYDGHPIWKDQYGYPCISVDGESHRMHRYIAEKVLGRKLSRKNIVHHVDGDITNYSKDNLVILEDIALHKILHYRMRLRDKGVDAKTHAICWRCKRVLPLSEFYNNRNNRGGLTSDCKECCKRKEKEKRDRARCQ